MPRCIPHPLSILNLTGAVALMLLTLLSLAGCVDGPVAPVETGVVMGGVSGVVYVMPTGERVLLINGGSSNQCAVLLPPIGHAVLEPIPSGTATAAAVER